MVWVLAGVGGELVTRAHLVEYDDGFMVTSGEISEKCKRKSLQGRWPNFRNKL